MRVRSILLGRYGGYEDRYVEFGPGLTVVVGPNEAGKSTLLDALTDVLWGYPRPVRHAYLVAGSRLDLTAAITPDVADRASDVVTIRRTPKSVSGPMPEWGVVEQDARRAWRQGFGLSHAELRRGGQTLCEGGGELAELVFAVRSGNDVRSILSGLAEEAERLYKPHKSAKSVEVRAAIGRADQAETQLRQQMATASDVAAIDDRIRRAEASRMNAAADHAEAADAAQLARQQASAFPHAVELARLRAEQARLHAEAAVPDQAQLVALTAATTTFDQAHRDLADLGTLLQSRKGELDALEIDDAVLTDAATITALGQQLQARAQDRKRLGELSDEAETHRRSALAALEDLTGPDDRPIADRLRDVHVSTDRAAALDELQTALTRAESTDERLNATHLDALRRVREAASSFEPIDLDAAQRAIELGRSSTVHNSPAARHQAAIAACATACDDLERAREAVRNLAGSIGPHFDPGPTTDRPAAGPAHATQADTTNADINDPVCATDYDAAKSDHPTAPLAQAPAAARMTELRDRFRAATTSAESAGRDHAKAVERLQQAKRALDIIRDSAPLPSAELLHEVRAQRDHSLDTMLTALRNTDTQMLMTAVVAVVRTSMSADRIADELIADADQLADLVRREADVRTADRDVTAAARALDATQQEHRFARSQWTALWTSGSAPVPHPDVADSVHRALQDAHRANADLLQAGLRRDELATEVAHLHDQLRAALAAAGHPRPDADQPTLLAATDELEGLVALIKEQRARVAALRDQARTAGDAADATRHDRDDAVARWRFGLAAAGQPTDLTPAQWAIRCDTLATIRRAHATAERLDEETVGMQTTLAAFDALLAEQAVRHGLTESVTTAAVNALSARLSTAEAASIAARHHNREITTLTNTIDTAKIAAESATETRQRIATELGIDPQAIPAALTRGQANIDLDIAVESAAALVHAAGPELALDAFLTTIEHHSQAELDETRDMTQAREKAHRAQLDAIAEELGGLRRDLDERHNTQPAATLHAIATEHTAQAAEAAQRYIVLQLQREILGRELAAYERQHSSQLLTTAGELLERLTSGRYVAVRPRTNDNQRSLLVVRADDEEQTLDELSEGTADQLYLALRLAGIDQLQAERTNQGLTTVPVVLDDILITFDDNRAAAALTVLAELSARWQIILLTHHDHLVDLARHVGTEPPSITTLEPPAYLKTTRDPQTIRAVAAPGAPVTPLPAPRGHTQDPGRVRNWARDNGLDIGERGRIPTEILDAYQRAGSATPELPEARLPGHGTGQ
jgi:recombinational DNA repair ATPase RecF